MHIPASVPWAIHRVATSGYYPDGLHVISCRWTLEMLINAWVVCDAYDAARARATEGAP